MCEDGIEPFAVAHSYDGYGWHYIDNGSGSTWLERGMKKPDAVVLVDASIVVTLNDRIAELESRIKALELSRALCANDLEDAIRDSYEGVWIEQDIQNHIARHMAPLERFSK